MRAARRAARLLHAVIVRVERDALNHLVQRAPLPSQRQSIPRERAQKGEYLAEDITVALRFGRADDALAAHRRAQRHQSLHDVARVGRRPINEETVLTLSDLRPEKNG